MPLSQEDKLLRTKRIILWLKVAAAIILVVILYGLIRGCGVARQNAENYKKAQDIIARLKSDSAELDKELADIKKDTAGTNELIELYKNDTETLENKLAESERRTYQLALKVKQLSGTVDTIDIPNDCTLLADAYLNELELNKQLRRKQDSLNAAYEKRIKQGDSLARHFQLRYENCMSAVDTIGGLLPSAKPRGKVTLDITGMYGTPLFGAGGGFTYIDKKGRTYTANVLATNKGLLGVAKYGLPLSFKRK